MRKTAAFQFIPELIGDFAHVMEMSGNPKRLYVETAIETLHAAASALAVFNEHKNTKKKKETEEALQKEYDDLRKKQIEHYEEEEVRKLDIAYEKVKLKIQGGQFRDKEVRSFIRYVEQDLQKAMEILNQIMHMDRDRYDISNIEEVARKVLRDYNKLLTIFIEEESGNGED